MELKGKVSVITGGTSGIGAATVIEFVKQGATVIFNGRNKEKGQKILVEIEKLQAPGTAVFRQGDIASESDIKDLADFVKNTYGNCEVLFNNAGIHLAGMLHETPPPEWDRIMNVDLRGVYLTCYYFLPQMLEKNYGTIIMMSSVSGMFADYSMAAYNTAKGAISNLTRAMALDYAQNNIRVNCVCPGAIRTEILNHTFKSVPESEELFKQAYPTYSIPEPKEVAELVVFLASRRSDFINGENIMIDGGITAHTGQPRLGKY